MIKPGQPCTLKLVCNDCEGTTFAKSPSKGWLCFDCGSAQARFVYEPKPVALQAEDVPVCLPPTAELGTKGIREQGRHNDETMPSVVVHSIGEAL